MTEHRGDHAAFVIVAAVLWGWRSGLATREPLLVAGAALALYTPLLLLNTPFNEEDTPYLFLGFPIVFLSVAQVALFVSYLFALPVVVQAKQSFSKYSIHTRNSREPVYEYCTPYPAIFIISILTIALSSYIVDQPHTFALTNGAGKGIGATGIVLGIWGVISSFWALLKSPSESRFLFNFASFVARAFVDLTIYLVRMEVGLSVAFAIAAGVEVLLAVLDVFWWRKALGFSSLHTSANGSPTLHTPSPLSVSWAWSIAYSAINAGVPVIMLVGTAIALEVGSETRGARATWTALIVVGFTFLVAVALSFKATLPQYVYPEAARTAYFVQNSSDDSSFSDYNSESGPERNTQPDAGLNASLLSTATRTDEYSNPFSYKKESKGIHKVFQSSY